MIQNYGLLWERKYVHFGTPGNRGRGTLYGTCANSGNVDFREQIGIYVLYDKDLLPVYIGQAGTGRSNLLKRLTDHHARNFLWNRWDHFSWFGLRKVNSNGSLSAHDHAEKVYKPTGQMVMDVLEGVLIAAMEPKLNKQGPCFTEAIQYFQAVDERIVDLTLEDIQNQICELGRQIMDLQKQADKSNK